MNRGMDTADTFVLIWSIGFDGGTQPAGKFPALRKSPPASGLLLTVRNTAARRAARRRTDDQRFMPY